MSEKLKYLGYTIVFQEVPNEVSLAINISGCTHRCKDCHSKYLWKYEGNYVSDDLETLIEKYNGLITCVCFMGGDHNQEELLNLLGLVKKKYKLKTALYTGCDKFYEINKILGSLDYVKIGHYDNLFGGVNMPTTNQKMFKYNGETYQWDNITHLFWRKNENH